MTLFAGAKVSTLEDILRMVINHGFEPGREIVIKIKRGQEILTLVFVVE